MKKSWGPDRPHTWQPKNSRSVNAELIAIGDLVLNSTCSAWYKIETKELGLDGVFKMTGLEVLGTDARGRLELSRTRARLSAMIGEKRVIGW